MGLVTANQRCVRCEMPVLPSDVYCPFCGSRQVAVLAPALHKVKILLGIGALIVIGIPAGIVCLVAAISSVVMLLESSPMGFVGCLLVGGVALGVLSFIAWALHKVAAK